MTDNEKEKELFRLLQHREPKPQAKKLSDEAAKKIADVLHIMLKDK